MKLSPVDQIYWAFRSNLPVCGLSFSPIQRLSAIAQIYARIAVRDPEVFNVPVIYWSYVRGFEWVRMSSTGSALLVPMPEKDETRGTDVSAAGMNSAQSLDPIAAIQLIINCPFDAVFVLEGLHDFLGDPRAKALFSRLWDSLVLGEHKAPVRDPGTQNITQEQAFGEVIKRVIVTGDDVRFPIDLRRHYDVHRLDLPGQAEVEEILARTCEAMAAHHGIPTELDTEQRRLLISHLSGSPREQITNLLRKIGRTHGKVSAEAVEMARAERMRLLEQSKANFIDLPQNPVAGLEVLMGWVRNTLSPIINMRLTAEQPELVPDPKGVILVGPPGTGKSLAAAAITNALGIPGIKLDMAALMNSGLGDSENNLLEILRLAEAIAPCVLFIDELDKSGLDGGSDSDGGTSRRMLQSLLSFLSKPKAKPVFVICTMNRLDRGVPQEFKRPGRFDHIFIVDLPNRVERAGILRVHVDKFINNISDKQIEVVAKDTGGFSGADLELLVTHTWSSVRAEMASKEVSFTERDILLTGEALKTTLKTAGMVPAAQQFEEEIRSVRAIAAHATQASLPDDSRLRVVEVDADPMQGMR